MRLLFEGFSKDSLRLICILWRYLDPERYFRIAFYGFSPPLHFRNQSDPYGIWMVLLGILQWSFRKDFTVYTWIERNSIPSYPSSAMKLNLIAWRIGWINVRGSFCWFHLTMDFFLAWFMWNVNRILFNLFLLPSGIDLRMIGDPCRILKYSLHVLFQDFSVLGQTKKNFIMISMYYFDSIRSRFCCRLIQQDWQDRMKGSSGLLIFQLDLQSALTGSSLLPAFYRFQGPDRWKNPLRS